MIALLLLALAESADAFAVSLAQGAGARHSWRDAVRVAGAFALAQGTMPLLGWSVTLLLGGWFAAVDHWISFGLLGVLGAKMMMEGFERDDAAPPSQPLGPRALFVTAIAISIDAAAIGLALPALGLPIVLSCVVIGIVTFPVCVVGVHWGGRIGAAIGKRAEVLGGLVLIGIGTMILGRHLGWF